MKSYPAATRVAKVELLVAVMSWLMVFGLIGGAVADFIRQQPAEISYLQTRGITSCEGSRG